LTNVSIIEKFTISPDQLSIFLHEITPTPEGSGPAETSREDEGLPDGVTDENWLLAAGSSLRLQPIERDRLCDELDAELIESEGYTRNDSGLLCYPDGTQALYRTVNRYNLIRYEEFRNLQEGVLDGVRQEAFRIITYRRHLNSTLPDAPVEAVYAPDTGLQITRTSYLPSYITDLDHAENNLRNFLDGFDECDYSDVDVARLFVRENHHDILHCVGWGQWLIWDLRRWREDMNQWIVRKATLFALEHEVLLTAQRRDLFDERDGLDTEDDKAAIRRLDTQIKQLNNRIRAMKSLEKMKKMLTLASGFPSIAIHFDELDTDGWLMNLENGTYDLRAGVLREHRREDKITKLANVAYDPLARNLAWERFVRQILPNENIRRFVQRWLGYSLTGDIGEQAIVFFYGGGGNGKGVLVNTVMKILGEYWDAVEYAVFTSTDTHETLLHKAEMQGKRAIFASEQLKEDSVLTTGVIKNLTGGDPIRARRHREAPYTYQPTFKITMITNHTPVITDMTTSIWRRIHVVPFDVTIEKENIIKNFEATLLEDRPGILNWLLEGLQEYLRTGLAPPREVMMATEELRQEMDLIQAFTDDVLDIDPGMDGKPGWEVPIKEIYWWYETWCNDNKIRRPLMKNTFGREFKDRMRSRDVRPTRRRDTTYYTCIRIKPYNASKSEFISS
jgi:putative DNA primase/helicase